MTDSGNRIVGRALGGPILERGEDSFPPSLGVFGLARDTSFWFFTDPFGVSFGLFLCLVDFFAHLCDPGTRGLYIDNKTLAIGRTNNPPIRESWIS
jgi:hypothetical protein